MKELLARLLRVIAERLSPTPAPAPQIPHVWTSPYWYPQPVTGISVNSCSRCGKALFLNAPHVCYTVTYGSNGYYNPLVGS